MNKTFRLILSIIAISLISRSGFSQGVNGNTNNVIGQDEGLRTITTAVPFLMIAPDSRSGAMGDAGVATTPDANSMHWNPSKYAFINNDMGASISYTPWLRKLVDDINLANLNGYYRLDKNQVFAASLLYFSLGSITFTDNLGNPLQNYNPHEFSLDVSYSRLLSKNFSGSLAARYIYSNLTGGTYVSNEQSHAGHAVAMDISAYYQNDINFFDNASKLAFGIDISNIGSKIDYTDNTKNFIPINLRLGSALTTQLDDYNSIMFTVDFNKLLVPTPPIYEVDSLNNPVVDNNGNQVIAYGKNPNVSVPVGIFQSFYDAPGILETNGKRNVFKEELQEVTYSIGAEYWYAKQFAIRAGYFHESASKGNRKYFTAGLGIQFNVFGLDFAYLIPTGNQTNNPLAETLRFSLIFNFENLNAQSQTKK